MRNQFVGDVNDFGKYGLVRYLCGVTGSAMDDDQKFTLGVVWYFQNGRTAKGGGNVGYLEEKNRVAYRDCDPGLLDVLGKLVHGDQRYIARVEEADILPAAGRFYREISEYSGMPNTKPSERDKRKEAVRDWLTGAEKFVRGADIVLLDPDHQINLGNDPPKISANGPLYAYLDEIKAFWDNGHSLVIYHQTGGEDPRGKVRGVSDVLHDILGAEPITLRFVRGGFTLVFFVIPQPHHRPQIEARIKRMLAGPWGQHFTEVTQ